MWVRLPPRALFHPIENKTVATCVGSIAAGIYVGAAAVEYHDMRYAVYQNIRYTFSSGWARRAGLGPPFSRQHQSPRALLFPIELPYVHVPVADQQ